MSNINNQNFYSNLIKNHPSKSPLRIAMAKSKQTISTKHDFLEDLDNDKLKLLILKEQENELEYRRELKEIEVLTKNNDMSESVLRQKNEMSELEATLIDLRTKNRNLELCMDRLDKQLIELPEVFERDLVSEESKMSDKSINNKEIIVREIIYKHKNNTAENIKYFEGLLKQNQSQINEKKYKIF